MSKFFIDTEFLDLGPNQPLYLLSIGIVKEDENKHYYAEVKNAPVELASDWVKENVLTGMSHPSAECDCKGYIRDFGYNHSADTYTTLPLPKPVCPVKDLDTIKSEIVEFIGDDTDIEFWGWCCGYDYVVFCQIFGTVMDLPSNFPHYFHELQYFMDEKGISDEELPQPFGKHIALWDAYHIRTLYHFVKQKEDK